MMNDNGARYIGDGDFALKNQTPEMKAVFAGTERTTNKNEGLYGNFKYYSGVFGTILGCVRAAEPPLRRHLGPVRAVEEPGGARGHHGHD